MFRILYDADLKDISLTILSRLPQCGVGNELFKLNRPANAALNSSFLP
jgi:hypothetical protein